MTCMSKCSIQPVLMKWKMAVFNALMLMRLKLQPSLALFRPQSSSSKQVQVLDIPLRPYKEAEERTQQVMRTKTIDLIQDTAGKFVHFNPHDIPDFVRDLVHIWKPV